jgi:uncharacterized protein
MIMIRKATQFDLEQVIPKLREDASRALFILGDIEAYGLETDFQDIWVDADDQGIHGIYLRYYDSFVWYILETLKDEDGFKTLLADERIINTGCVLSHFELLPKEIQNLIKPRFTHLCVCHQLKDGNYEAELAVPEHAHAIINGMDKIVEFESPQVLSVEQRIQRLAQDLDEKKNFAMILQQNGQVVAHAMSAAHTSSAAMIIGVFTLLEYRHQGLARKVVGSLSQYLLEGGRTPVLFYDNPKAGQLYHDLGFTTIDQWVMGTKVIKS